MVVFCSVMKPVADDISLDFCKDLVEFLTNPNVLEEKKVRELRAFRMVRHPLIS